MMLTYPYEADLQNNVDFYADGIPHYLTKQDVRNYKNELVHKKVADTSLQESSTSGTTGEPLSFLISEQEKAIIHECYCRPYLFFPNSSYKAVAIRHYEKSDTPSSSRTPLSYQNAYSEKQINHYFKFLSSKEPSDVLAKFIYEDQPQLLEGYISSINLVAHVLIQKKQIMDCVEIISSSGEFINESYRSTLAKAFPNSRLFDRYGAEELGALAWQCPLCGNYHFNSDFYAIKQSYNNDLPIVTITKRYVSAFQLANYDVGDLIKITGMGLCDVELPCIEIIAGRSDDILLDENNNALPVMSYHFDNITDILQWQIIQQSDLSLDVNIIASQYIENLAKIIEAHVRDSLGGFKMSVRINFVKQLSTTRKFKRVISNR